MKKIAAFSLISSVLSLTSSLCLAMPSHPEIFSGTAEVQHIDSHTMQIKPSDGAILQYKDFQIGSQEKVRFLQNSTKSCVLNRITGENPSQILGSLESNGKVFLVNPNGIYFGRDSKVNVGSLIASTLDIADEDFTSEKYHFTLNQGKNSSIVNEGVLHSAEGSIVLLASQIRNLGQVEAKLGSVVLASGEHVTLDFTGDGLIQFSVEGSLKEALIEHLGEIHGSIVSLKLPTAKKAITEIVNMDGACQGDLFVEENGVIKFTSVSQIQAKTVHVEGSQISVLGSIDVSDALDKGGDIHLFGREIVLDGALINASGLLGGGEVLIGGEFQGKGTTPYASKVTMDQHSEIYAEAIDTGSGGLVVLWSQDQTIFHGTIYAQGGLLDGLGGLVETSSKGVLNVEKGIVNTLDGKGKAGEWLLDPSYMNIVSGSSFSFGFGNSDTSNFSGSLGIDNFLNLSSNVTVLANFGININDSFSVTGSPSSFHPNLTFQTGSSGFVSVGDPSDCSKNITITTSGGSIDLVNVASFFLQCPSTTINTSGGAIQLNSLASTSSCYNSGSPPALTINAGTGAVSFNAPYLSGNSYPIGPIIVNTAGSVRTNNLYINGDLTLTSIPLQISGGGTPTISTNGHNISTGSIDIASGYTGSLNLIAGPSSTISIGAVGSTGPLTSFTIASDAASHVTLSDVTTTGGDISLEPSSTFSSTSSLTANGGLVSLASATTSGTVVADGSISFAADSIISGTFTAGGGITSAGSLVLGGTTALTAPSGIAIASGISGSSSYDLALAASSSSISVGGDVSSLHSFTISSASAATLFNITTSGGQISIASPAVIQGSSGTIISGGGNITFTHSILPSISNIDLTINAGVGAIGLQGMGESSKPFGDITLTGGTITLGQDMCLNGGFVIDNSGALAISSGVINVGGNFSQTGTGAFSLGDSIFAGGSIGFQGDLVTTSSIALQGVGGLTIPGSITTTATTPNLTINAGNNPLTILSLGSDSFPFGTLSITTSDLSLAGNIITSSVFSAASPSVTISSPITISADTIITGPDGITLNGAITTTSVTPALTLDAGLSPLIVSGVGNNTYPLGTLSMTGSSLSINGNIVTSGSIGFVGPVTIATDCTLQGSTGITFGSTFVSSLTDYDLTLVSSGPVSVVSLGSGALPLGDISITSAGLTVTENLISSGNITLIGSTITLGPQITALENITIENTGLLSIPPGTMSIIGNFNQTGVGNVSLGTSITTAGSISFEGAVTITSNVALEGELGITVPGSIIPNPANLNLTLNTGTNPLSVQSLGSSSFPLGTLTILASEIALGGNVYTSSSISLSSPITIAANTSLTGPYGITLSGSITASSGNPSLTLTAASGPIDVVSLGSNTSPLGAISLIGTSVTLGGDVASIASIGITGPVVIDTDLTLRGDTGITLSSSLLPSTNSLDLVLEATSGSVSVKALGSRSLPLGDFSVIGQAMTIGGNITSSSIAITAPVTLSSSSIWKARGGITTSGSIDGPFALTLDGVSSTQGVITIGGSVGANTRLSSFIIQNALQSSLSSVFTNVGLVQITSPLLLNNHTILSSSGGNIELDGVVNSQANTHYNLSVAAGVGTILIGNNVGAVTALGSFTVNSAQSTLIEGSILSTLGSTSIYSPLISSIPTLTITSEAYGSLFITSYMGTNSGMQNLTLAATQNVQIGPMGSSLKPLGTIVITGSAVTLEGSVYAQGSLSIANAGELSIEAGDVSLGGGFSQTSEGSVSLGKNITANTISFQSPITLSNDSILRSNRGITLSSSVNGAFDFSLMGTIGDVTFQNCCLGCVTPLGSLTATGKALSFSGNVELHSSGNMNLDLSGESSSVGTANLVIDAGSSIVYLGPIGLNTALSSVSITAGLLQTRGIGTSGGAIAIHAPVRLNASQVVFDTTRNGSSGAAITVDSAINSFASAYNSLSIVSGIGEITLSGDLGNTSVLDSVSIASTHSFIVPNITTFQDITISAPVILSNTPLTTFASQNNGNITLGSVDGTSSGAQRFTADTKGVVSLGVVGGNIPLEELVITSASEVHVQSVTTQGVITLTPPILLTDSATLRSSGSLITLGSINGISAANQSLTVDAGSAELLFMGNIGSITPLKNLALTGSLIDLEGSLIYALGSQSYNGPVVFAQSATFQAQGNITFASSLDAAFAGSDLSFYMGKGDLTFAGSAGDAPFGAISVFNASGFTAQDILAGSLKVSGGSADIALYGDVNLSDLAGISLDGKSIQLVGNINALYRFFRAREITSHLDFPVSLNISDPTPRELQYINLVHQNIGTQSHPIEVSEDLVTGSYFRADFVGDLAHDDTIISFADSSYVLTFNGQTIVNNLTQSFARDLFLLLPKDLFYLPGIYSSWNNLSNDEYFQQEPINLGENPRNREMFYTY